jgi:hypothetical protein
MEKNKFNQVIYAVFTTVSLYFLFKIALFFSLVTEPGSNCLSSLWDNSDRVITPYITFLTLAILSFLWLILSTFQHRKEFGKTIYLIITVSLVFYYFWFKGFYGFWYLMQYEQNKITVPAFFAETNGTENLKFYGTDKNRNELCK